MKIAKFAFLSALVLLGLTSCEKDLYSPDAAGENKTIKDLVIPANFDWAITKDAKCKITSDHSAQISIYLDAECSENNLLATLSVNAGTNMSVPLSIPKDAQEVYVQYTKTSGKKSIVASAIDADGNIEFAAPADSKKIASKAEGDFEDLGYGLFYYPQLGGGTILFEDEYPNLGDYDFNDFVARYEAEIHTEAAKDITNGATISYVNKIKFSMTVNAVGGRVHYIPSLRIPFNINTIKKATLDDKGAVNSNVKLEQLSDKTQNGNAVFIMDGAEKNEYMVPGSPYLNTENGFYTSRTLRVIINIEFYPNSAKFSDLTANLFDLFLVNKDKTKEIHLLGYGSAFGEQGNSLEFGKDQTTYKQAGSNLVWAISIPKTDMPYPYEKANFLNAYTSFAQWVEGGGKTETDWYTNNNKINKNFLFDKKAVKK